MRKPCFGVIMEIAVFIGIFALAVASGGDVCQAEVLPANTASVSSEGILLTDLGDSKIRLTNQIDGYSVILPAGMRLVDTSSTSIRIVLEDEHRRLEIYKQQPAGVSASTKDYISYSNRFLGNGVDHYKELQQTLSIGGYPAEINQWRREKLSRVLNDKNHYASIDIIAGSTVYNFFVKSDVPFYETGGYMELVEGFDILTPTVYPTFLKIKKTVNRTFCPETKKFYEKYFSADSDLTWGIFEYTAPEDFSILDSLEKKLGYQFTFLVAYKHMQKAYPPNYVKNTLQSAYDKGRVVELTLQTTDRGSEEGNMVYGILKGEYDTFLKSFAAETAEFGHPVLFRFCNEMNGDWCQYSGYHTSRDPELFKELYRYVYEIFREAEADNVIWVWNPNEKSFPNFKWNNEQMYYPGDEYVDVVGLTGYNTGTYYSGEIWRSFTEIYDPLYKRMVNMSAKPLMITEFSSSSIGGNKAQWVRMMTANIHKYPRIKVAIWWDGCDWDRYGNIARSYFIDESEELINVFKEYLQGLPGAQ